MKLPGRFPEGQMKRLVKGVSIFILCVFLYSGCKELTGSSSSPVASENSSGTVTATESSTWTYSGSSPAYEVAASVLSLTVTGTTSDSLAGKTLYLAKVNPTAETISSDAVRYVVSSEGFSADTAASSIRSAVPAGTAGLSDSSSLCATSGIRSFVPPQTFGKNGTSPKRTISIRSVSAVGTVTAIEPVVDTTTKKVYIDQDSSISTFAQAQATLRAVGTYCYVWVVDDYYTSGSAEGDRVDSSVAEAFAGKFDSLYPLVRNIFGDESDKIYTSYSGGTWTESDMGMLSDTGTMVNIVIYDIGGGDGADGGTVGYFYAKDYYPDEADLYSGSGYKYSGADTESTSDDDARIYSNEGKYFYVDSYYAASSEYRTMTYSTLAHEFQHMIDWNVKNMEQNLSPSTWYNEMLSMLCEDMMQESLGVSDIYSPKERLATFNQYYRYVGLEYNSSSSAYELISYASAYAFGAWCARQFGGAAFLRAVSLNASVDTDSVAAAVNSLNGTSYTIGDLLGQYIEACVFNSTTLRSSYAYPTFNQDASESLSYSSYSYPMTAINLWSGDNSWTSSGTTEYGPLLYGAASAYCYDLRPYGITLHTIGTASGTAVTITFSSTGSASGKLYILVQSADDYSTD